MALKDFKIIGKLGEGAYSCVYKVQRIQDNQQYALKKVKLQNLSEKEQQNALNEIRILASIHHENIIGYKQAFLEGNNLCIIMQFANDGDLYQKIVEYKNNNNYFEQKDIWNVLIQVTRGLKILHQLNIFHRDLKSANVFLSKDGVAKLGDMNVSKIAKNGLLYTQTGTPYYASPQVWKDQPYDSKSDIWSLGCVIYQMTTLKPPFRAEDMEGLYKKVIKGTYSKIANTFSQQLSNVIRSLLQVNPGLRPSAQKILSSSYVKTKIQQLKLKKQFEGENELLKTIKVPKNFHYLTDRLPKPTYSNIKSKSLGKPLSNDKLISETVASQSKKQDHNNSVILPKLQHIVNQKSEIDKKKKKKIKNLNSEIQIEGNYNIIQDARNMQSSDKKLNPYIEKMNKQLQKVYRLKNQRGKNQKKNENEKLPPLIITKINI